MPPETDLPIEQGLIATCDAFLNLIRTAFIEDGDLPTSLSGKVPKLDNDNIIESIVSDSLEMMKDEIPGIARKIVGKISLNSLLSFAANREAVGLANVAHYEISKSEKNVVAKVFYNFFSLLKALAESDTPLKRNDLIFISQNSIQVLLYIQRIFDADSKLSLSDPLDFLSKLFHSNPGHEDKPIIFIAHLIKFINELTNLNFIERQQYNYIKLTNKPDKDRVYRLMNINGKKHIQKTYQTKDVRIIESKLPVLRSEPWARKVEAKLLKQHKWPQSEPDLSRDYVGSRLALDLLKIIPESMRFIIKFKVKNKLADALINSNGSINHLKDHLSHWAAHEIFACTHAIYLLSQDASNEAVTQSIITRKNNIERYMKYLGIACETHHSEVLNHPVRPLALTLDDQAKVFKAAPANLKEFFSLGLRFIEQSQPHLRPVQTHTNLHSLYNLMHYKRNILDKDHHSEILASLKINKRTKVKREIREWHYLEKLFLKSAEGNINKIRHFEINANDPASLHKAIYNIFALANAVIAGDKTFHAKDLAFLYAWGNFIYKEIKNNFSNLQLPLSLAYIFKHIALIFDQSSPIHQEFMQLIPEQLSLSGKATYPKSKAVRLLNIYNKLLKKFPQETLLFSQSILTNQVLIFDEEINELLEIIQDLDEAITRVDYTLQRLESDQDNADMIIRDLNEQLEDQIDAINEFCRIKKSARNFANLTNQLLSILEFNDIQTVHTHRLQHAHDYAQAKIQQHQTAFVAYEVTARELVERIKLKLQAKNVTPIKLDITEPAPEISAALEQRQLEAYTKANIQQLGTSNSFVDPDQVEIAKIEFTLATAKAKLHETENTLEQIQACQNSLNALQKHKSTALEASLHHELTTLLGSRSHADILIEQETLAETVKSKSDILQFLRQEHSNLVDHEIPKFAEEIDKLIESVNFHRGDLIGLQTLHSVLESDINDNLQTAKQLPPKFNAENMTALAVFKFNFTNYRADYQQQQNCLVAAAETFLPLKQSCDTLLERFKSTPPCLQNACQEKLKTLQEKLLECGYMLETISQRHSDLSAQVQQFTPHYVDKIIACNHYLQAYLPDTKRCFLNRPFWRESRRKIVVSIQEKLFQCLLNGDMQPLQNLLVSVINAQEYQPRPGNYEKSLQYHCLTILSELGLSSQLITEKTQHRFAQAKHIDISASPMLSLS